MCYYRFIKIWTCAPKQVVFFVCGFCYRSFCCCGTNLFSRMMSLQWKWWPNEWAHFIRLVWSISLSQIQINSFQNLLSMSVFWFSLSFLFTLGKQTVGYFFIWIVKKNFVIKIDSYKLSWCQNNWIEDKEEKSFRHLMLLGRPIDWIFTMMKNNIVNVDCLSIDDITRWNIQPQWYKNLAEPHNLNSSSHTE